MTSMPEPLVLVPGLMCDASVWQHQKNTFELDRDVQVPAHGTSDALGAMAERILDTAPPRFALAGHSMGGRVALEVLARAPERVTRLALLDTGYEALAPGEAGERERAGRYRLRDLARAQGIRAMAREWARGMVHPSRLEDAVLMEAIYAMIARAGVTQFEAQIHALLNRENRTALLGEIAVPTLVLCGREDNWAPVSRHEDMARRIAGSQLAVVPDAGHMSTMEQPEAVTAALRSWLRAA